MQEFDYCRICNHSRTFRWGGDKEPHLVGFLCAGVVTLFLILESEGPIMNDLSKLICVKYFEVILGP